MSLNNCQIKFLKNLDKNCIHGKNILAKRNKNEIKKFYNEYHSFVALMEEKDIEKKIDAFIKYKTYANKHNTINGKLLFSAQSKFEPTILEEFLFHLFKDFSTKQTIGVGSVKAYNNLYFSPVNFNAFKNENFIKINQKDQDFSIYKSIELKDDNYIYKLSVPIVSIECKTYLDKTMLEGSIATAEKIKSGNPLCKFYIVTETYEVDYKVDPSTSRIDNIFVLKKGGRTERKNQFSKEVIKNLYKEINQHIKADWSNIANNIKIKGLSINIELFI